jgi:hypothetical protein
MTRCPVGCPRRWPIASLGVAGRLMLTLLFLLLFFGLLAAGMPIFLVLGMCAGILYLDQ